MIVGFRFISVAPICAMLEQRPPARMVANHIWALSHGVVELFARGKRGTRSPISAEDMLNSGVLVYLRGLGIIGD